MGAKLARGQLFWGFVPPLAPRPMARAYINTGRFSECTMIRIFGRRRMHLGALPYVTLSAAVVYLAAPLRTWRCHTTEPAKPYLGSRLQERTPACTDSKRLPSPASPYYQFPYRLTSLLLSTEQTVTPNTLSLLQRAEMRGIQLVDPSVRHIHWRREPWPHSTVYQDGARAVHRLPEPKKTVSRLFSSYTRDLR
jgi:hypothetical protein